MDFLGKQAWAKNLFAIDVIMKLGIGICNLEIVRREEVEALISQHFKHFLETGYDDLK